jgi:hypothetical protein
MYAYVCAPVGVRAFARAADGAKRDCRRGCVRVCGDAGDVNAPAGASPPPPHSQIPGLAAPMVPALVAALTTYVLDGGCLVLTADDAGLLPDSITGLTVTGAPATVAASAVVDRQTGWAAGAFCVLSSTGCACALVHIVGVRTVHTCVCDWS